MSALKQDRPLFVNTFIKANFNVSKIFYEKQTNKPWSLNWRKLSELYKEDDSKKVRNEIFIIEFISSIILFLERTLLFSGKMSWKSSSSYSTRT